MGNVCGITHFLLPNTTIYLQKKKTAKKGGQKEQNQSRVLCTAFSNVSSPPHTATTKNCPFIDLSTLRVVDLGRGERRGKYAGYPRRENS